MTALNTEGAVKALREALEGAPIAAYSPEDKAFYRFWYGHMLDELMQPPLANIDHATARYIWNAALDATAVMEAGSEHQEMRIALIGQVHELIDIAERHAWTSDPDEKRRTEGAIAHARKVTAPYNYNGNTPPAAIAAATEGDKP